MQINQFHLHKLLLKIKYLLKSKTHRNDRIQNIKAIIIASKKVQKKVTKK
jgi:hypothetical protein